MSCGAAARTRLAASPGWRAPLVALVVVLVLSLGVLAGALVKLAGGSPAAATQTTTVTRAATATTATTQGGISPESTAKAVPGTAGSPDTTAKASAGAGTSAAGTRTTTKGHFGINLSHLKRSVAERLRKLGLGPSSEK